MTPKDKAWELVIKYRLIEFDKTEDTRLMISIADAKECALIAVDEMIDVYASACVAMGMSKEDAEKKESKYLFEVKQEIEKL